MKILNVFDIDDTLFKSDARVGVVSNGKRIKDLEPGQFNTYQLKKGEKFDFDQFRSGKHFKKTAKPIINVLEKAKRIVNAQNNNSKSIIVTARSDMKDKKDFLDTFRRYGFPIDNVYVERAGNLEKYKPGIKPHITKAAILRRYIKTGNYDKIVMWDDSKSNLDILFKLAKLHPEIKPEAYLVDDGKISRYSPNLNESIYIPPESLNISRELMPQITSSKRDDFIKTLKEKGTKSRLIRISPRNMKATQSEFNVDSVLNMIHTKTKLKPTIISRDNYILDGHHRWLADLNTDKNKPVQALQIDLPILDLLAAAKSYSGAEFRTLDQSAKRLKTILKEAAKERSYK